MKLSAQAIAALESWNIKNTGRHLSNDTDTVTDPRIIKRLMQVQMPGETVDETIIRITTGGQRLQN